MRAAHSDAKKKKKEVDDVLGLFGYSGGAQVSSIAAALCLFVAQEFVGPQERHVDLSHTHTHTYSISGLMMMCAEEPPQHSMMPGEHSDSG